jgi:hypothetical protein
MKLASIALVAATLLAAQSLYAQAPPAPTPEMQAARDAMRKACGDDMKKLCADKTGREAMQCMRANADKVSPDCKDAMAKMRAAAPPPQPH